MRTRQILNAISTINPTILIENVYQPYVDDDGYLNATMDYPYGTSVYHFQLSLYVDSQIISVEIDMDQSKILDQNFKHSENYVDVIKAVIENKITAEILLENDRLNSYED
jgi:predicted RNA methylase